MKTFLFLLSLPVLLVFSACSPGQFGDTASTGGNPAGGQRAVPQQADRMMKASGSGCEQLKLDRENCVAQVEDIVERMLQQEIRQTFDLSRCSELSEDFETSCRSSIENSGVKGPITPAQANALREAVAPDFNEEDGTLAHDLSKCVSLDAAIGLKAYCEKVVQRNMDQEKIQQILTDGGDVNDCDTLSGDLADRCRTFFGVFDDAIRQ